MNIIGYYWIFIDMHASAGKWTTYRSMACDTVDRAVKVAGLKDTKGCQTNGLLLEGAQNWYPTLFIRLIQDHGLDVEVK